MRKSALQGIKKEVFLVWKEMTPDGDTKLHKKKREHQ